MSNTHNNAATALTWEAPPSSGRGRPSVYGPLLEALQERPGEWARISQGKKSPGVPSHLVKHKARGYEFASRRVEDGTHSVYARYMGAPEDEGAQA